MPAESVEAMKREVLRLLGHTGDVLKGVADSPNLLHEHDPQQQRQLDTVRVKEWKRVLCDETKKVKDLEAVFAVIGTVNAGKSTTINAIVGAEILPHRSEPMTTYPTLVRHKPGQTEPVLDFRVVRSFESLARKAKEKLEQQTRKTQIDELYPDPHQQAIAKKILEEEIELANHFEGKTKIFESLKTVNDLYRLCGRLGLDLPATVSSLPTLEIEMHHIGADDTGVGRFAVLDLPGPNEFGQSERLRKIVQTQLTNASAVVLVSDFTQLETDADVEVRKLVENELTHLKDRLFIFVNKFDQRRAKGRNEEETRQYLAKKLGTVKPEHIYPVSAQRAFLANWAQRQLKECDHLPDPETNALTKDFGDAAFGVMWEDDIEQIDRVRKGAERLWERSLFAGPLDNVVRVAARHASLVCLKSATAKLLEYQQTLNNFLNIRNGATTKDLKELQQAIKKLQDDRDNVHKKKESVEGKIRNNLDDFPELIRGACESWSGQLRQIIEECFKTDAVSPPPKKGRRKNREKFLSHSLDRFRNWARETARSILPLKVPERPKLDLSPQQTREFRGADREARARKYIEDIRKQLQPVYDEAAREVAQRLDKIAEDLAQQTTEDVETEVGDILEEAQERLQRDFQATVDFPKLDFAIDVAELDALGGSVIESGTEIKIVRRKKSHFFAEVTRFFGSILENDWGYDVKSEESEVLKIHRAGLQDAALKDLDRFSSEMQDCAKELVQTHETVLSCYFDTLGKYLEEFRGDLLDALEDKQREADSTKEYRGRIQKLLSELGEAQYSTQSFHESLEAHG